MEEIQTDNLFLIEFLVARVDIDPNMILYPVDDNTSTCVSVQFLDNLPLSICEEDFSPKSQYDKDKEKLKTGKSCLFSLTPEQVQETLQKFDITVDIFKKTHQGEKVTVGTSLVPVGNIFKKLIRSVKSASASDGCPVPPAEMLRSYFKINNSSGQYIGDINMYIRISCFGKQIITRFQMVPKEKAILFKDKAGNSLYKYKKVGQGGATSDLDDAEEKNQPCGANCPAGGKCGRSSDGESSSGGGCGKSCSSGADSSGTGGTSKNGCVCCGSGNCPSGGQCEAPPACPKPQSILKTHGYASVNMSRDNKKGNSRGGCCQ